MERRTFRTCGVLRSWRRRDGSTACAAWLLVCVVAPIARADPPSGHEREARVRADRVTRDRAAVEDTARFATSIDVRARGALVEGVGELLDEAPGVHVRSSGDALAPATVSVRGAPAQHVTVALDGVVLNDASSDGVDLSLVPPVLLERADVYRGAAPVRLGAEGLGGTVELITRAPGPRPESWASLGGGSFAQRRAAAAVSVRAPHDAGRALLAVSYRGTQGDFTFFDDHGTPLFPDDDRSTVRVNNAGNALDVLFRGCVRNACVLATATAREHGLPGPGQAQYSAPHLVEARGMARASLHIAMPSAHGWIEPYILGLGRRDRFTDASGLLIGSVIDARSVGGTGEAGLTGNFLGEPHGSLRLEPAMRLRVERFDTQSANGAVLSAGRVRGLLGGDARLVRGPVEFAGGLALDALGDDATGHPSVARVLLSPRFGARVHLTRWIELRANGSLLARAPTLPELYGIGGYVSGNPALVPERSQSVDAGAVASAHAGLFDARFELAGYARHASDLLVFVRSTALSLTPINLRGADITGLEASARLALGHAAALVASYAFTHAITRAPGAASDGLHTPSIPAHDLYVRAEGGAGPVRAWAELSYVAGIFYDELDRLPSPARALVGAAVTFTPPFARWLTLAALGSNLLDQRDGLVGVAQGASTVSVRQPIADFAGYPLPGRAFFVSLQFHTGGSDP